MSTPTSAESLIRLMDMAETLPSAVALRTRSYELLELDAGARVVDAGCGTGRAVVELAERGARAVGVDAAEEMVAAARKRWPVHDFRLGDVYRLPLGDGEVAGYRADKVLHVLTDAPRALREARRVLAPGGRIVLIGQDWDTFVIDSDDPRLTRVIVHARADLVPDPRVARRYRNLLLDAGFEQADVEVHTAVFTDETMLPMLTGLAEAARAAGAITGEQHAAWTAEQRERARNGRLFLALPLFVAIARRPC
ncbi:methyltransferase domain-containing protein [Nonomuraea cavernae]|uniref:methyltransferase domain-containing protein n=1 Tax=Nonomuraea cavernae TaxID=2045107 RepID=UPI0033E6DB69